MDWKVIFLAFLMVSSIAAIFAVYTQNTTSALTTKVLHKFGASVSTLYLNEVTPLEPIDVDGPGG